MLYSTPGWTISNNGEIPEGKKVEDFLAERGPKLHPKNAIKVASTRAENAMLLY